MPSEDTYTIRSRFLTENGWTVEDIAVTPGETLYYANQVATTRAAELDRDYGDSHFWTVDILGRNNGSYYQYFHGRIS